MPRARHAWAALLGALVLLTGATARADDPYGLSPRLRTSWTVRTPAGRLVQDICDRAFGLHCLARRLLPAGTTPPRLEGPALVPEFGGAFCQAMPSGTGGKAPDPTSMAPSDVVAAYGIPASTRASGAIVAVVDMPDSTALADLTAYRAAFGLPALPACESGLPDGKTPCFAQVDAAGKPAATSIDCPGAADVETALDLEMVSAACPDCSLLLVQMTGATMGPTAADLLAATQLAAKLGAVATSISFGGPETGSDPAGYTTPGHLVLAASGDNGYLLAGPPQPSGTSPSYPASAPDVLSVGGTTLSRAAAGYSEVVWNDGPAGAAGSGCSIEFPVPSFQKSYLSSHAGAFGACAARATADVSAAAQFASGNQETGIAQYSGADGWIAVVGTSAAAPLLAGIFTRLGVAASISRDLGFPYENEGAFHDVTMGDDLVGNTCPDMNCRAGPGWDGPTGVGTPDGAKLTLLGQAAAGSGSGGCGCVLPGAASRPGSVPGAALAILFGLARRRRKRRL